jgi:DNA-binding transcriptional regulator YiaG
VNSSEIIKEIRSHLNVSQEDLARELKVSFATVNRWENGKSTPSKMAKRLLIDLCENKKMPDSICEKVQYL